MGKRLARAIVIATITAVCVFPSTGEAGGNRIVLMLPPNTVPVDTPVTILVIGGPMANVTVIVNICGVPPGTFPLQNVGTVSPHGAPNFTGAVVIFPVPLQPGTRLSSLQDHGRCTVDRTEYQVVSGIVDAPGRKR